MEFDDWIYCILLSYILFLYAITVFFHQRPDLLILYFSFAHQLLVANPFNLYDLAVIADLQLQAERV